VEATEGAITVRIDSGVGEGGEISVHYDPMIAKLITHAPTRKAATKAQADALDAFTIDGIRHNIPFLAALMRHKRWQAGELSTSFIPEEYPGGFHTIEPGGGTEELLAGVAAAIDHVLGERKRRISGQRPGAAVVRERTRVVRLGERDIELEIWRDGEALVLRFNGAGDSHKLISGWKPGDTLWSGTYDEHAISVQVRPVLNGFELAHRGIEARSYVYTAREAEAARKMPAKTATDSGKALRCPMPGLVRAITVAEGQDIKAGEALAIVEAMKMENVLRAERDGIVKRIKVRPGETLAVDAVIMEFD
jgi:propionyl-CoA carboxylase alpha chain